MRIPWRSAAAGRSTALAALVAAWAPSVASAVGPCDVEQHARPPRSVRAATAERPPLEVGDSTSLLAAPVLAHLGIEADARGCRQFRQGVDLLAARRRAGRLPRVVVLALGANGSIEAADVRRALRILGPRGVLVLVTARRSPLSTARARAAARAHPARIALADWVAFSRGHDAWFAGDGLHVGTAGAVAYARFLRRALVPLAFPPVASLRLPPVTGAGKECGVVRRPGGPSLEVEVIRGDDRVLCARARALAAMPPLRPPAGWRTYDWRFVPHAPWMWVTVRADRDVVIGTVLAAA